MRSAEPSRPRLVAIALVVAVVGMVPLVAADPAAANPIGGSGAWRVGTVRQKGFDTCAAPTTSVMQKWWNSSPYWDVGIYIGGSNRGCSQPNLTSTWASQVHSQGWNFYLTWVGPQAPCSGYRSRMSSDAGTAYQQGRTEARSAISAARNVGFTGYNMYYYDMEAYDTGNASCRSAVKSFVNGWVYELRAWGAKAGAYGSGCGSAVSDWGTIANPPDTVWVAHWNNDPDVWGLKCVPEGYWVYDYQRLHQYRGGHNESWGGITINIDNDCASAYATPDGRSWADSACTTE